MIRKNIFVLHFNANFQKKTIINSLKDKNYVKTEILDKFVLTKKDYLKYKGVDEEIRNKIADFDIFEDLKNQKKQHLTPFEFHSKYNTNKSYVDYPRLSVTKLLTKKWCELKDYLSIYTSFVFETKSNALKQGKKRHLDLEKKLYGDLNNKKIILNVIENFLKELHKIYKKKATTELQKKLIEHFKKKLKENESESVQSNDWVNNIIIKLHDFFFKLEIRELNTHMFINLKQKKILTNVSDLHFSNNKINPSLVLISGIIDQLKIINKYDKNDFNLAHEVKNHLNLSTNRLGNNLFYFDLIKYFKDLPKIIKPFLNTHEILFSEIKFRTSDLLPIPNDILFSAKLQTFYYKKMFSLLSQNIENKKLNFSSYRSFLLNAKVRNLNVDLPINVETLIFILRNHFSLFYNDFLLLAEGKSIGLEEFDNDVKSIVYKDYDLTFLENVFTNNQAKKTISFTFLDMLGESENFSYREIFNKKLLKKWKIPPTLRYFIARASQFYSLFQNFSSNQTTVEYYDISNRLLQRSEFIFDEKTFIDEFNNSCSFWMGEFVPKHTDNLSKCSYCEFGSKCSNLRLELNSNILNSHSMKIINEFLNKKI